MRGAGWDRIRSDGWYAVVCVVWASVVRCCAVRCDVVWCGRGTQISCDHYRSDAETPLLHIRIRILARQLGCAVKVEEIGSALCARLLRASRHECVETSSPVSERQGSDHDGSWSA